MSATSCLLSKDQFQCSICLDLFTDPVSTSCGHNFCRACINSFWNDNVQCVCPLCNEVFHTKPELKINTFISEMAAEFKASSQSEQPAAKPREVQREVQCDFCTATKQKAIKFCRKCESSYCQTHLKPHLTAAHLKSHQLVNPVQNLDDKMCKKHDKPLELYCKTDQTCVCSLCPLLDHKNHEFVPLEEEYERKKATLRQSEAEIKQKIQQRERNIKEMKQSTKLNKEAADRERAEGDQAFTVLKQCVEKGHAYLVEMVNEKQKITEKQAEDFVKELQLEISELMARAAEIEQLSQSGEHVLLLQRFPSISSAPSMRDWSQVRVQQSSYEGIDSKALTQVEVAVSSEVKKLLHAELKRIKQFAVVVTLPPNVLEPSPAPSDNGKQVDAKKKRQDNVQKCVCRSVLAKQSFSSGSFYFEVLVKGKCKWAVGVARESTNRKGGIILSPQNGYWVIMLRSHNEILACDKPHVHLSVKSRPDKVGVFVDYKEGLVSFYDVGTGNLIFSFVGLSFSNKLRPFSFCVRPNCDGKSSAPLTGSAVNHTAENSKSFFGAIRCHFKKKSFNLSKVK